MVERPFYGWIDEHPHRWFIELNVENGILFIAPPCLVRQPRWIYAWVVVKAPRHQAIGHEAVVLPVHIEVQAKREEVIVVHAHRMRPHELAVFRSAVVFMIWSLFLNVGLVSITPVAPTATSMAPSGSNRQSRM